jgi:hypothetical protein
MRQPACPNAGISDSGKEVSVTDFALSIVQGFIPVKWLLNEQ